LQEGEPVSVFDRVKTRVQELFGRAEEVYGQAHGDPAATVAGEANRLEAEAEEAELEQQEHRRDDDGLAGQGAVR
jgi:uncharacterized protein YjbJ (UPF0337 family)